MTFVIFYRKAFTELLTSRLSDLPSPLGKYCGDQNDFLSCLLYQNQTAQQIQLVNARINVAKNSWLQVRC